MKALNSDYNTKLSKQSALLHTLAKLGKLITNEFITIEDISRIEVRAQN